MKQICFIELLIVVATEKVPRWTIEYARIIGTGRVNVYFNYIPLMYDDKAYSVVDVIQLSKVFKEDNGFAHCVVWHY